jgi:hypothetical protein
LYQLNLLNGETDITLSINVGLGAGSKEQQIVMLNNILERQLQAFQLQGNKEYPMVTLKNIYNSV